MSRGSIRFFICRCPGVGLEFLLLGVQASYLSRRWRLSLPLSASLSLSSSLSLCLSLFLSLLFPSHVAEQVLRNHIRVDVGILRAVLVCVIRMSALWLHSSLCSQLCSFPRIGPRSARSCVCLMSQKRSSPKALPHWCTGGVRFVVTFRSDPGFVHERIFLQKLTYSSVHSGR